MENNIDSKINGVRDGVTQIGKDVANQSKEVRVDAHAAIDTAAEKVTPIAESLVATAHNSLDKVADGVESVANGLEGVSERLAARSKQVGESYKKLAESGRTQVRANPAISVLIAAAAGYGISKLLSSRSSK